MWVRASGTIGRGEMKIINNKLTVVFACWGSAAAASAAVLRWGVVEPELVPLAGPASDPRGGSGLFLRTVGAGVPTAAFACEHNIDM